MNKSPSSSAKKIDKQNSFSKKQKGQSFGKQVKARILSQNNQIQKNKSQPVNRIPMIKSYYCNQLNQAIQGNEKNSLDENNQSMSKSKMVRFSQGLQNNSNLLDKSLERRSNSILKNSTTSLDVTYFQRQNLSQSSLNSHKNSIINTPLPSQSRKDKGIRYNNGKRYCLLLDQYMKIKKILQKGNNNFFDDMFPPGGASLYHSKINKQKYCNIRWKHLKDIFPTFNLTLRSEYKSCKIINGIFKQLNYQTVSLNAIGQCTKCLDKIFQNQTINNQGLYYLRINHSGIWKYIIIDDFIPILKSNSSLKQQLVFMNVLPNSKGQIEIWPFLVQKVLAKIYGCYECLMNDTVQNNMYELTGCIPQIINLHQQMAQYKIRTKLSDPNCILFIRYPSKNQQFQENIYNIQRYQKQNNYYFSLQTKINLIINSSNHICKDYYDLRKEFSQAILYQMNQNCYSIGCTVKQAKKSISLRKFTIYKITQCSISIIQKDKKYYHNNGYKYIWVRLLIVMKQNNGGYRWINGSYSNNKILNLPCELDIGEYYVIIMNQFIQRNYEMNLNYQGSSQIKFQRKVIQEYPNILEQSCMDLAQRFGSFKQINRNLCVYSIIDSNCGLIIENINNQSCKKTLMHKKFQWSKSSQHKFEVINKIGFIFIEANMHYTIILKMIGGIHSDLVHNYKF